ncbi:MAG: methyltransferase domain-containing protein [Chitinophagaceae bacterium]
MNKAQLIPEGKMCFVEKKTLRTRLNEFYEKVDEYPAFEQVTHQAQCWIHVENEVLKRIKENAGKTINVLEIGAGRSGFGEWLKARGLREKVRWSVQDVTFRNAAWLESQTDQITYGDVSEILDKGCFDIVFSTYVLEHVTDPSLHLEHLHQLLRPAGSLFIFCPRYDMPGYLCPSSRHLSWMARVGLGVRWGLARFGSWISHHPAFLIQTDVAAFHGPFFLDADAVHWVSLLDLKLWAQTKGARLRQLKTGTPPVGSKDWIVKRWLTCAVEIHKGE